MEYEFTTEELMELEKALDIFCGQNLQGYAQVLSAFYPVQTKESDELVKKVVKESFDYYDMLRTLSAKAALMRKELQKE